MIRKNQVVAGLGAAAIMISLIGITVVAVALDRWDIYTQYDQTIYYSAVIVIYLTSKMLMRLVKGALR